MSKLSSQAATECFKQVIKLVAYRGVTLNKTNICDYQALL